MEDSVPRQAVSEQLRFIEFRTGFLQEYVQKTSVAMTQPILCPFVRENVLAPLFQKESEYRFQAKACVTLCFCDASQLIPVINL